VKITCTLDTPGTQISKEKKPQQGKIKQNKRKTKLDPENVYYT